MSNQTDEHNEDEPPQTFYKCACGQLFSVWGDPAKESETRTCPRCGKQAPQEPDDEPDELDDAEPGPLSIFGLRCPKCGHGAKAGDTLTVLTTRHFRLRLDGDTVDPEDCAPDTQGQWDDEDGCVCDECLYQGTISEFTNREDKAEEPEHKITPGPWVLDDDAVWLPVGGMGQRYARIKAPAGWTVALVQCDEDDAEQAANVRAILALGAAPSSEEGTANAQP